jgi:hypothetical protein
LGDTRDEFGTLTRDQWSDLGDTRDQSGVLTRDEFSNQRTTDFSRDGFRRSGFRGLDRAIDQLDTNADRFRDRTGGVNQGLQNARERLRDNRARFDDETDFDERD